MVEVDEIAMTCRENSTGHNLHRYSLAMTGQAAGVDQLPAKWKVRFQLISGVINVACQDKIERTISTFQMALTQEKCIYKATVQSGAMPLRREY